MAGGLVIDIQPPDLDLRIKILKSKFEEIKMNFNDMNCLGQALNVSFGRSSIKDKNNHEGDIQIKYTGKRPVEKLFEELLISDESEKTSHPLIFKAIEEYIPHEVLAIELKKLRNAVKNFDKNESLKILKELVPEWENRKKELK